MSEQRNDESLQPIVLEAGSVVHFRGIPVFLGQSITVLTSPSNASLLYKDPD